MRARSWVGSLAAMVTLCLLGSTRFARPHTDPAHRSALQVTLTLADGTRHAASLQGVGCSESMCSRVRAQDSQADSIWLDGLASVRPISGATSGPLQVVLGFKDGTERTASIRESNRVLYLTGHDGHSRTVDLNRLTQVEFIE
jgi:hypothetical protein